MTQKPKPGDLIEINRVVYQHWAIYVGDGYVIHLNTPSENAGSRGTKVLLHDRAIVEKEKLYKVVGDDDYCINNLLDDEYEPRPIEDILRDAHRLLGKELRYCVVTRNCEHFVTELRYGKPESRQVQKAVERVADLTFTDVLFALGAAMLFLPKSKQRQKK